MDIAVLLGRSQYDVTRCFAQCLGCGFEQLGHNVVFWDAADGSLSIDRGRPLDVVFSLNAAGFSDGVGSQDSFYSQLGRILNLDKIVFLWHIVDNPIYHLKRLEAAVNNRMVFFVDQSFPALVRDVLKIDAGWMGFMPHAGVRLPELGSEEITRDIDVLFTSSAFNKPERVFEKAFDKVTIDFMSDVMDYMIADRANKSIWESILSVAARSGYEPDIWGRDTIVFMIYKIDSYLRDFQKYRLLESVLHLGLKVHVYGKNWENHFLADKLLGKREVLFSEIPLLNARAKLALNSNGNLTHGSHERVFNAMINGAIPLIDGSSYYEELFPGVCLSIGDKKEIGKILQDENYFAGKSQTAQKIALASHTWQHRAERMLDAVKKYQKEN